LAEAGLWEGQSVRLDGWATDVRPGADGTRFTLVDGADSVAVRVSSSGETAPSPGDRVQVAGRLGRWQGQLRLDVEDGDAVHVVPGPKAAEPSWGDLATQPEAWRGRLVLVRGQVEEGRLRDGSHSVMLGEGPWPKEGAVQARGLLRDDPSCLCHRLDAREVWPWTP
jgi:hypothetical protein